MYNKVIIITIINNIIIIVVLNAPFLFYSEITKVTFLILIFLPRKKTII